MKIIILGGFLGSGKTSVLLQLAHYLVDSSERIKETTVAIIENEIGQVGIDDKVLRRNGYEVRDIFSGCICCSLNNDLITGIQDIKSKNDPEWLIIEATGVAYPGGISDSIYNNLRMTARIVTIVDASRWQRIRIPLERLIEGQLSNAQIILINKTDLVDEETLNIIENDVRNLNDKAALYRINGVREIDETILQVIRNG
ncbi:MULTISPECIES: GTP-binding protein [unclassified Dehalobacter]|uniref:GTP-binding protein n=1 Tax=unclassified Dehalobacter TaxID=2635733 RepID=UPI0005592B41|nr:MULTISPECIES: GTP-binding protein [unclassified Dehalobacter]